MDNSFTTIGAGMATVATLMNKYLAATNTSAPQSASPLTVTKGQITFDAEGNDNPASEFFTRKPHVPSESSGITIGRGYDLSQRTSVEVLADFKAAGISTEVSAVLAKGVGLQGAKAEAYLAQFDKATLTISAGQQKALFERTYAKYEKDTEGYYNRYRSLPKWRELPTKVQEVFVDLLYRGDFTPYRQRTLTDALRKGGVPELVDALTDRASWIKVPSERFRVRKEYLLSAM